MTEKENKSRPEWIEVLESKYLRVPAVSVEEWKKYCTKQLLNFPSCVGKTSELINLFKPIVMGIENQALVDWLTRLKTILSRLNKQESMRSIRVDEFTAALDNLIPDLTFYKNVLGLTNYLVQKRLLTDSSPPFDLNNTISVASERLRLATKTAIDFALFAEGSYEKGYSENEAMINAVEIKLFDERNYSPIHRQSFRTKYFNSFESASKARKAAVNIFTVTTTHPRHAQEMLYILSNSYLILSEGALRTEIYRERKRLDIA